MARSVVFMKLSIAWLVAVVCAEGLGRESNTRPAWLRPDSDVFTPTAACHTDVELLDLCQRCAKLTKSRLAYPVCCSTDMQARKWCSDYVYFGTGV